MTVDRASWGDGPWTDEPDEVKGEASGLQVRLVRGPFGAWCGYVGVPKGHRLYGRDYSWKPGLDIVPPQLHQLGSIDDHGAINVFCAILSPTTRRDLTLLVRVHGGLTYSAEGRHLPSGLWWLGFDCSHSGDRAPGLDALAGPSGVYRTLEYARHEVERLALQVAAFEALRKEQARKRERENRARWARSFNGNRRGRR